MGPTLAERHYCLTIAALGEPIWRTVRGQVMEEPADLGALVRYVIARRSAQILVVGLWRSARTIYAGYWPSATSTCLVQHQKSRAQQGPAFLQLFGKRRVAYCFTSLRFCTVPPVVRRAR